MNNKIIDFRRSILNFMVKQIAIGFALFKVMQRHLKIVFFYQRRSVILAFKDSDLPKMDRPKVLIAVSHITSEEESKDREKASAKIEKLKNTIDGLLASFAHCDLKIFINTLPQRSIVHFLPEYQQQILEIIDCPDCDPMFVGFRAQEYFIQRVDEFDWFFHIEDDIIIYDGYFIQKIANFNEKSGYENALLFPHRYELWEGKKSYIDLTIDSELSWSKLTSVEIDGIKYAEFTNPHSGLYCLSSSQLKHWIKSGRQFKNAVLFGGILESATTYCLTEYFTIYKPHPDNMSFFEVRHYDTKYSQLYPDASPYIVSGVNT